jgi:hypothetical protein
MIACVTGKYSFAGSTSCDTCPNGYYCDSTGIIHGCPAGMMCNENAAYMSLPRPCRSGYYCKDGVTETSCPSGTYSVYSTSGHSVCTPVPPGYGFTAANHPPVQCGPGYYNDVYYNTGGCSACPTGYACPGGSSGHIKTYCELGTYAPVTGMSSCLACPQGYYCSTPSSFPTFCSSG